MLISKTVKTKWNSKNKNYFVDLGYKYTKMGDEFEVKTEHLSKGSNALVNIKCDYCNKEYTKYWYRYIDENMKSTIHKDCCNDCKKYKIQEVAQKKYGVNSVFKLQQIKDKIEDTNIEKYGVKNPFSSEEIKNKIKETNLKKYGYTSATKSQYIQNKIKKTCMEKYGVPYFIITQRFYGEESPCWKGGISAIRYERCNYEYRAWRKSVFSRDLYTCQCCGIKNKAGLKKAVSLNAHHIKNWKDNPDDRYKIDNGITLCEQCHIKFHSMFGKKHTTNEQLISFINSQDKKLC